MDIYHPIKTCSKCGIDKPISEFNINKSTKDGYFLFCKSCKKEYDTEYYKNNKQKIKYRNNLYVTNNREKRNKYVSEYNKNRKSVDSIFKLKVNARNLIGGAIKRKGYKKNTKTEQILGCDWHTLKTHIEAQFDSNMTWDNYGLYWDIDHIIPASSALSEEEMINLNHYTNLRPLESYYNRYIKRHNFII